MKFYSKSRTKGRKNALKAALGFFRNRSWEEIKVNFIVSTGRTGTQFLTRFFRNLSSQIDSCHEPDPDFLKLGLTLPGGKFLLKKQLK